MPKSAVHHQQGNQLIFLNNIFHIIKEEDFVFMFTDLIA